MLGQIYSHQFMFGKKAHGVKSVLLGIMACDRTIKMKTEWYQLKTKQITQ